MIPPKNPPTEDEAINFLTLFYNVSEEDIKNYYQDEIDAYLRLFTEFEDTKNG